MSDPQNLGLGELGQRVQAMSDPVSEPRLRPYQGAPLPIGTGANGRPIPSYEMPEDAHMSPTAQTTQTPYASPYAPPFPDGYASTYSNSYPDSFTTPVASATPEPAAHFGPLSGHTGSSNGTSPASGTSPTNETSTVTGTAPPSAPATPTASEDPNTPKSGLQRAVSAVRSALPLVQRLLPLLEGNFASVIGALMAPQPSHTPPPKVDLEPIERSLAEVYTTNRELRTQMQEQATSLKRVEDHLERVREATDRNTLEQQELIEDLRSVGNRVSTFAIIGVILLALSVGINIYFLVQLQHILR